jgi:hypothetical protein
MHKRPLSSLERGFFAETNYEDRMLYTTGKEWFT